MDIADFPKFPLAHLPTPLELLPHLSRELGGPEIFVKRDDCTGLASGGNKTRKLEYLIGEALENQADTIVTVGATQSNHVRQTIAAAAKAGLACEVLLEQAVTRDDDYEANGNVLLDRLMGATIHTCEPSDDLNRDGQALANELAQKGANPTFIPLGGSSPLGALGYVECAFELLTQTILLNIEMSAIFVATGSQGTQAGLLVGLAAEGNSTPVHGIAVSRPGDQQAELVLDLTRRTEALLELGPIVPEGSVLCDGGYYGPGYGQPNDAMVEAVRLCARLEGLILDPVYSGKAMAGLIDKIRNGAYTKQDKVVFIHTGGQAALGAYRSVFD